MSIGAGIKLAERVTGWIDKFIKRKDASLEKNAGKDALMGNESGMRRIINKLYKKRK